VLEPTAGDSGAIDRYDSEGSPPQCALRNLNFESRQRARIVRTNPVDGCTGATLIQRLPEPGIDARSADIDPLA